MRKSRQQIIEDITAHIRNSGGGYDQWYIGTSVDPMGKLFDGHQVLRETDDWIVREAESPQAARDVVAFFETTYGMDAMRDPRHGAGSMVHAYRKSAHTDP